MTLQDILLRLARASIEEQFGKPFSLSREILMAQFPELAENRATFVTINIDGDALRGCIGSLLPHTTLFDDVVYNAKAAAFGDSRFFPLSESEYPYCSIEISILTLPEEVRYKDAEDLKSRLRPGIDGVILQQGGHTATFLPQVWEEFRSFDRFFGELGVKAGIKGFALDSHPGIFTYQAERFEDEPLEEQYNPVSKSEALREEETVPEPAAPAGPFATPEEAETAFYRALERGELNAMLAVWADDEAVVCIHPGGKRLLGRESVALSWREMLAGQQGIRFDTEDLYYTRDADLSIHSLRERIYVNGRLAGVTLATNVYRRVGEGWRLLIHHASHDPAAGR